MRASVELYEHPELSTSEVWGKDAYNRSGAVRALTTVGVVSVVTLSTIAGCQLTGLLDLSMVRLPRFLQTSML